MPQKITQVVALSENNCIGLNGDLPWHLPADLKRFKQTTMGHPMIMGRKTFESIGRVLPGRPHIVVTRSRNWDHAGVQVAHDLDTALTRAAEHKTGQTMVIGGGEIFTQALPKTDILDLCRVHADVPGDTFFPDFNPSDWRETLIQAHPAEGDRPAYTFLRLERLA